MKTGIFLKGATLGLAGALALGGIALAVDSAGSHPTNHGGAVSAVAKTQGEKISALAHSTTGTGKGDVISAAARLHGAAVSLVAHSTTNHGSAVSQLATTTTASGEAKGDAISTLARNGHGPTSGR